MAVKKLTIDGSKAHGFTTDATDFKIISLLRKDGRMAYRTIASELDITEATVRTRVKRLEESNTIKVVAVTDIEAAGFDMLLAIGVELEGRAASEVGHDLAKLDEVYSVSVVIGSHDIEILALARDQTHMNELLTQLAAVKGVRKLLPSLAVDVLKNQPNWVPFNND
ncbi:MAG: DNA-binding Lrp family transcriptional regulator [Pseudomonadales bacterium]